MGYLLYSRSPTTRGSAYFGQGNGPVWLDDLNCSGIEAKIWDCNNPGWGRVNCGHGEDVGVECF